MRLLGYDVVTPAQAGEQPLARAGDTVAITLFWRPTGDVPENYGGFVHLIDRAGKPLARVDGMPGRMFRPPALWDRYRTEKARYELALPAGAPGGLYWPAIGLYNGEKTRFPIWDASGKNLGDTYRLPPIKVIGAVPPEPQYPAGIQVGEFAELVGYDLEPDSGTIAAGQALTLTLQFRSLAPLTADYTRFVQLRGESMVAQSDEPPAGGSNPTSTWVPGEIVTDRTELRVSPGARPGPYKLAIGMYDRKANDERVALLDKDGTELPERELILRSLVIDP